MNHSGVDHPTFLPHLLYRRNHHEYARVLDKKDQENPTIFFRRGPLLGYGTYGTVHLAQLLFIDAQTTLSTSYNVAVKSARYSVSDSLKREADLMLSYFNHCPHLLRCHGTQLSEENGAKLYNVFLEYASGGSLEDLIKKSGVVNGRCLPEDQVRRYTKSLLLGLQFIHDSGFIHCDVKPSNILLDDRGDVKIADFGLTTKRSNDYYYMVDRVKGTPLYMSPEIANLQLYGPFVDIWALGCTVVQMITGEPLWDLPCEGYNPHAVLSQIRVRGVPEINPKGTMSRASEDFVRKCLQFHPKDRWTAEMLLQHPFIVGCSGGQMPMSSSTKESSIASNPYWKQMWGFK